MGRTQDPPPSNLIPYKGSLPPPPPRAPAPWQWTGCIRNATVMGDGLGMGWVSEGRSAEFWGHTEGLTAQHMGMGGCLWLAAVDGGWRQLVVGD